MGCDGLDWIQLRIDVMVVYCELTPRRQNQQVHHRIHKSLPPIPVLSQVDPLYTLPANLHKIHCDPILPSMPWSFKWSLSFWLSHQNLLHGYKYFI
jgi:hypothetical protein